VRAPCIIASRRTAVGSAVYAHSRGKLAQNWPLEQDKLLERLQKNCDMQQISTDYNALFVGEECRVSPYRSAWQEGATEAEVRAFLSERGMPLSDTPADHIGTLLLAASWIEDNAGDDENEAIEILFETYLLPWVGTFRGKLKPTPPLRSENAGPLTRDAIAAMWDELEEESEE
jgi:TorA maturation chaperone TorD